MARGRQTLSQRIALDGGEDIRRELSALGKEGEAAFKALEEAAARSGKGGTELQRSIQNLQKSLNEVGKSAREVGRGFQQIGQGVSGLGRGLADVGKRLAVVAAAATAAGFAAFKLAEAGSAAADSAAKQAQALGLPIDAYGRLQFAAEQSGVSAEGFSTAITRLNQELGRAAQGNESAAAKFTGLGVAIKAADGNIRSTEEILGDLAQRFATLPDGAEKSALAIELFGRSGAQLLPFLNEGRAGLAALGAEAERLGITFTADQAKIATALQDSLNRLKRTREGLTNELGLIFAPGFTAAADGFTEAIARNRDGLIQFAEKVVPRATRVLTELIQLFISGGADINNLDPITLDIATQIVEAKNAVKDFGTSFVLVFDSVISPAIKGVRFLLDGLADGINALFGTAFDGTQIAILIVLGKLLGLFKLFGPVLKIASGAWVIFKNVLLVTVGLFKTAAIGAKLVLTALAGIAGVPALIAFAVGAAIVSIFVFWDEIKASAIAAFESVVESAESILGKLDDVFASVGLTDAWETVKQASTTAFKAIFLGALSLAGDIDTTFDVLLSDLKDIFKNVGKSFDDMIIGIKEKLSSVRDGFSEIGTGIAETFDSVTQIVVGYFTERFNAIRTVIAGVADGFRLLFSTAIDAIIAQLNRLVSVVDNIISRIRSAIAAVKSAVSSATTTKSGGGSTGSGTSAVSGFATGGHVRGPGTATSDSILAMLSDGEFVARTKAVKHYGVGLFDALNNLRIPKGALRQILGGGRGYAKGGRVSMKQIAPGFSIPGFSLGGLVQGFGRALTSFDPALAFSPQLTPRVEVNAALERERANAMHPLSLTIGGETFTGMMAPEATAQSLMRVANSRSLLSGGRKPGWYFGS